MLKKVSKEIAIFLLDLAVPAFVIFLVFNQLIPSLKEKQKTNIDILDRYEETEYIYEGDTFHASDGTRYTLVTPSEDVTDINPTSESIRKLDRETTFYSDEFERLIDSINKSLRSE